MVRTLYTSELDVIDVFGYAFVEAIEKVHRNLIERQSALVALTTRGQILIMGWIKYAIVTACALAAADLCVKLAANRISSSLLMLIYGCCTFSTGLAWVLWQWTRGIPQHAQLSGVLASIGMGFAFSGVTIGLYVTFSAGAPISLGSPVIRFGGILLTSIAGMIFLREPLTLRYVIGVLLVCSGMYLIITR